MLAGFPNYFVEQCISKAEQAVRRRVSRGVHRFQEPKLVSKVNAFIEYPQLLNLSTIADGGHDASEIHNL